MSERDLKTRTKAFALRILKLVDALPKTPSEKIEKYKLKKMAEQRRAQLWDREKAGITLKR